jgi:hypothetical protein
MSSPDGLRHAAFTGPCRPPPLLSNPPPGFLRVFASLREPLVAAEVRKHSGERSDRFNVEALHHRMACAMPL